MTDTKHTDSVEKLKKIEDSILSRTEPHFVDGTKILLDDYKATLQATHQQQVEAMSPDIREDFYKWFTARKGQKDIADWWLARTSQQVEEAVLQADATGAYHSGYLAGKAEVEEAVRKERERIEEQVLTPLYEKIDKWFQEKHDIIGQGALAAVFEEALQAITPNHQD